MAKSYGGLEVSHIWGLVAVLSLFITLGSCCACTDDTKTEYGSEELYVTSGGQIKSAPHTTTTGPDKGLVIATLVSGLVFVISFSGWMFTSETGTGLMEEAREREREKFGEEIRKRHQ